MSKYCYTVVRMWGCVCRPVEVEWTFVDCFFGYSSFFEMMHCTNQRFRTRNQELVNDPSPLNLTLSLHVLPSCMRRTDRSFACQHRKRRRSTLYHLTMLWCVLQSVTCFTTSSGEMRVAATESYRTPPSTQPLQPSSGMLPSPAAQQPIKIPGVPLPKTSQSSSPGLPHLHPMDTKQSQ